MKLYLIATRSVYLLSNMVNEAHIDYPALLRRIDFDAYHFLMRYWLQR